MKISFTKNNETRYACSVSMVGRQGRIISSTTDKTRAKSFPDNVVNTVRQYYADKGNRLFHQIDLTI